ncbi:hypothetical protein C7S18_19360 [Ahniella affigens]|uniref:Membrane protein insertion efficiency factor YidD n=1 Tax=Ahniella affigens TaxID=2021234 RepID=A0A2P1PWF9_9GAMM|nr:hypothetical protein C7S18_19360 [Ahniella affigens]
MRALALLSIRLYQRYLSPLKGFRCAYCTATGRPTCSNYGYRAIKRHGILVGIALLKRRLARCGDAAERLTAATRRPPLLQRGDCDPGCAGGCDAVPDFDCDLPARTANCHRLNQCESFLGCSPGCDWPSRSERKRRNRQ